MQNADYPNTIICDAIEDDPSVEGRGYYEETQIAEFPGTKAGARPHFRKVTQQTERFKSRIQKGTSRHVVIAPDVIPALDQVLIYFGGRLPFHGFKSP